MPEAKNLTPKYDFLRPKRLEMEKMEVKSTFPIKNYIQKLFSKDSKWQILDFLTPQTLLVEHLVFPLQKSSDDRVS